MIKTGIYEDVYQFCKNVFNIQKMYMTNFLLMYPNHNNNLYSFREPQFLQLDVDLHAM